MTAESDIAAIDDGGANTAAEVRTALTSVLGECPPSGSYGFSFSGSPVTASATAADTASNGSYAYQETYVAIEAFALVEEVTWDIEEAGTYTLSINGVDVATDVSVGSGDDLTFSISPAVIVSGVARFRIVNGSGSVKYRYKSNEAPNVDEFAEFRGWAGVDDGHAVPITIKAVLGQIVQLRE